MEKHLTNIRLLKRKAVREGCVPLGKVYEEGKLHHLFYDAQHCMVRDIVACLREPYPSMSSIHRGSVEITNVLTTSHGSLEFYGLTELPGADPALLARYSKAREIETEDVHRPILALLDRHAKPFYRLDAYCGDFVEMALGSQRTMRRRVLNFFDRRSPDVWLVRQLSDKIDAALAVADMPPGITSGDVRFYFEKLAAHPELARTGVTFCRDYEFPEPTGTGWARVTSASVKLTGGVLYLLEFIEMGGGSYDAGWNFAYMLPARLFTEGSWEDFVGFLLRPDSRSEYDRRVVEQCAPLRLLYDAWSGTDPAPVADTAAFTLPPADPAPSEVMDLDWGEEDEAATPLDSLKGWLRRKGIIR